MFDHFFIIIHDKVKIYIYLPEVAEINVLPILYELFLMKHTLYFLAIFSDLTHVIIPFLNCEKRDTKYFDKICRDFDFR